jgi:uncharacterized protein
MTVEYQPDRNRFSMPTSNGEAFVDLYWDGNVMELAHAEVPSSMRGTGTGARLAQGVFEAVEAMGVKARPTCPFLLRVAQSDPRWQKLFGL